MSLFGKKLGDAGEDMAAAYLKKKGYAVLDRNYKAETGEIDLVVSKGGVVVFVEVKTRSDVSFGYGYEAVDCRKKRKIIRTAQAYLAFKKLDVSVRFDVVSLDRGSINHIENAFTL